MVASTQFCNIVPPHILSRLASGEDPAAAEAARSTLKHDADFFVVPEEDQHLLEVFPDLRKIPDHVAPEPTPSEGKLEREVSDARKRTEVPGRTVWSNDDKLRLDVDADRAYHTIGGMFEFFDKAYGRNSIDGAGLPMNATVHYGKAYLNVFWDGERVRVGDGDGSIIRSFSLRCEPVGHAFTHAIIRYASDLAETGQSGALNESLADVFAALMWQRSINQTAEEADWLIGANVFGDGVKGTALRSLKAPGTAYDDDRIGKDPQPSTMKGYVDTSEGHGGIYINSGIPNHAFYLTAHELGGYAWERAGQIWYDALTGGKLAPDCDFTGFARLTVDTAQARYGEGVEARAVRNAWNQVGVSPS
ncbi:M4 family metallopeptidase [Streptomyces sp. NPDC059627]